MAISSISSVTTITPQTTTPAQADAAKSADSDAAKSASSDKASPAPATPAPTVLTQGAGSAHHHKKVHHPLPGQPGYVVNKKA